MLIFLLYNTRALILKTVEFPRCSVLRGEIMLTLKRAGMSVFGGVFLATLIMSSTLYAEDDRIKGRIPEGVYIELTKEFYEALQNNGYGGTKTYSNDPSKDHLKQIAISTRFMVETNLQILKQQEKMIRLLEDLNEKK